MTRKRSERIPRFEILSATPRETYLGLSAHGSLRAAKPRSEVLYLAKAGSGGVGTGIRLIRQGE